MARPTTTLKKILHRREGTILAVEVADEGRAVTWTRPDASPAA